MKLALAAVLTLAATYVLEAIRRRRRMIPASRLAHIEEAVEESRRCRDRCLSAGLERMSA